MKGERKKKKAMASNWKNKYPEKFRQKVCRLYRELGSYLTTAREFDLDPRTVKNWVAIGF
jgi:transposase-like protein